MAAKINLLPSDLGPRASLLKLANLSKKVAVLVFIVFFVFGTFTVGYIFFLKYQLSSSQSRQGGLKVSISSLQKTEQDLYLLKERLGKIRTVLNLPTAGEDISDASQVLGNSPGITITNAQVDLGKSTISGSCQSSQNLEDFFGKLLTVEGYKSIKLTSFSYNPATGYVFNLELSSVSTTNTK